MKSRRRVNSSVMPLISTIRMVNSIPRWVTILLGVISALWAAVQFVMTCFYMRTAKASTVDPDIPLATLTHRPIRSALTFATLSLIFFLIVGPRALLFVAVVLVLRACIDLVLFSLGTGMFRLYLPDGIFAGARTFTLSKQIGKLVFFILVLAAMVSLVGLR
jgi:hypothetical protein